MPFEARICELSGCGREFIPRSGCQRFCCYEHREQAGKHKPLVNDPYAKFRPVLRFIEEHYQKTGQYLKYGQAVILMEKGEMNDG